MVIQINFRKALMASLVLHVLAISVAWIGTLTSRPAKKAKQKQTEVIYQPIEEKKVVYKKSNPQPKMEISRNIKNVASDIDLFKDKSSVDVSKLLKTEERLSPDFEIFKKTPQLKTSLNIKTEITMPQLHSEKINNTSYTMYSNLLHDRIEQAAYEYFNAEDQVGEVYLTFAVKSNGQLRAVQIIESKTDASAYLREVAKKAIVQSSPFPPFPKELNFPELTFNLTISFRY